MANIVLPFPSDDQFLVKAKKPQTFKVKDTSKQMLQSPTRKRLTLILSTTNRLETMTLTPRSSPTLKVPTLKETKQTKIPPKPG